MQLRNGADGEMPAPVRSETGSYGRSAAGLTVALGVGGVLTYVFFILASRSLGEDQYGEIVVLWSVVFIVASTLYRPIEQLLARTLAERDQAGAPTGDALRTAGWIQLGVCLATLVVLLAVKGPLEERLFGTDPNLYWAMLVALAGFALAYFARGYLAGKGRFSIYAALLISEVVGRLVFAVLVAIGILDGATPIAIGIAVAPFCGLLMIPLMTRRYPSVPAKLRARQKPIERRAPERPDSRLERLRLVVPAGQGKHAEVLGRGPDAAPAVVEIMRELGVA